MPPSRQKSLHRLFSSMMTHWSWDHWLMTTWPPFITNRTFSSTLTSEDAPTSWPARHAEALGPPARQLALRMKYSRPWTGMNSN
jgi:hypothetical protein